MRTKDKSKPHYDFYYDWLSSMKKKGVPVELTLQQWLDFWNNSGQWENRGRGRMDFCMCRKDTEKPFSVTNIELRLVKDKGYINRKTKS